MNTDRPDASPDHPAPPRTPAVVGWVCVVALVSFVHVGHWPGHATDVDPANFRLALERYDIARDTPHPPGYPLYVAAGRAAGQVVGAAYAYQLVNLLLHVATATLIVLILLIHTGRSRPAVLAGLLFAAHPIVFAATLAAETYVTDAFYAVSLVLLGTLTARSPRGVWFALILLVAALCSLTRIVSLVLLTPACLYALLWAGSVRSWALRTAAMLAAVAAVLVAGYLTTMQLAGGAEAYRSATDRVMGNAFRGHSVFGGAPLGRHLAMLAKLGVWLGIVALPVAALLIVQLIGAESRKQIVARLARSRVVHVVVLVTAPFLALYALIYYLKPTYLVIVIASMSLLAGLLLSLAQEGRPWTRALSNATAAAVVLGFVFTLYLPKDRLPDPLARLTFDHFVSVDRDMRSLEAALRPAVADGGEVLVSDLPAGVNLYMLRSLLGTNPILREVDGRLLRFDGTWSPYPNPQGLPEQVQARPPAWRLDGFELTRTPVRRTARVP
ncbi:MAG: hypothetical protein AAF800_11960 [Planctomycetota bacterium]